MVSYPPTHFAFILGSAPDGEEDAIVGMILAVKVS